MMKMKTLFVLLVTVIRSKCYLIPLPKSTQYHFPMVNIRQINESIVYIKGNNSDNELITSILMGLYSDQPVVLSNGEGTVLYKKGLANRDPNVIVLTEAINLNDFKSFSYHKVFNSYWSVINIVMTTKSEHNTCSNGIVNKEFFENAYKYMNFIWVRYRVVRIMISFPHTCPHHFIIFSGKRSSNRTSIYSRDIKVVRATNKRELKAALMKNSQVLHLTEGYPLRANIFARFPTSTTLCKIVDFYTTNINLDYSNNYCGMDGLLMHDFIQHYKYNLSTPKDEACNKYGYMRASEQHPSGSLGCVLRNQLDISFNSRFMTQYTTEKYFYLHYVSQDSLCVLLKTPEYIPLWHYAYKFFNNAPFGITLLILLLLMGVLTWISSRLNQTVAGNQPHRLQTYILNSITSTLFGFPIVKSVESGRILRGTSLCCSIIVLTMYQGDVNYEFTTRTRYKEIKTLKQLYQSDNVLVTSPSIQDLLLKSTNPEDTERAQFFRKIQLNESIRMSYPLDHANTATLVRGYDANIEILLNFTDGHGAPQLYIVDQCFGDYYLSFITRAGFLFIEESLIFMMRMLEAGLANKYYVWTRRTLKLGNTYPLSGSDPRPFDKTKMRHLRVAFGVLLFGYAAATCAFVVEIYRARRR